MKQAVILTGWFFISPIFFLFLLGFTYRYKLIPDSILLHPIRHSTNQVSVTSSAPILSGVLGVNSQVQTADARPIIIAEFLRTNASPLTPYDHFGQVLTDIADRYNLDFRLLPSIMMQESNLCKKIPEESFNCLGLGIHSRGTWTFSSYEENFEAAAKILREKYIDQGFITPEEIQSKYTPHSNGSWEFAVNHFMEALETAEF